MSFSLSSFKNHKVIKISLLVLVVVAVVVFSLIKLGVISADSTVPTYSYTGIMRTSTGHDVPNKLVANGTIALARYYVAANCSGASTVVSKQVKSDSKGSFTLTGLSKGCYSANLDGSVKNSTGQSSSIGVPMKIVVPAIAQATAKNFWSDRRVYQLVGTFNREVPIVKTPTATATATTYSVSGILTNSSNAPIVGAIISEMSPQYPVLSSDPTKCDTTKPLNPNQGSPIDLSATVTTDSSGAFTLEKLSANCHTLKIYKLGGLAMSRQSWVEKLLATKALAASDSTTVIVAVSGTGNGGTFQDAYRNYYVKILPPVTTPTPTPTPVGQGTLSGVVKEYGPNNVFIGYAAGAYVGVSPYDATTIDVIAESSSDSNGSYIVSAPPGKFSVRFNAHDNNDCQDSILAATIIAGQITTLNGDLRCGYSNSINIGFEVMVGNDATRPDITGNGKVAILDDVGDEVASVTGQQLSDSNWKYGFLVPVPNSDTTYKIKATGFSNTRPGNGQPVTHSCQSDTLPLTIRPDTTPSIGYFILHLSCP